jgi:hypothetical protein
MTGSRIPTVPSDLGESRIPPRRHYIREVSVRPRFDDRRLLFRTAFPRSSRSWNNQLGGPKAAFLKNQTAARFCVISTCLYTPRIPS